MSTLLPLAAVAALTALSQAQAARRPRQTQPIQPSAGPARARRGGGNDVEGGLHQAWHQTTAAAAQAIQREGFRLDLPRAGRTDTDMPNGVFLKFTADEIGVARTSSEDAREVVQLPVQAMVRNPLRVWNREHLRIILTHDHRYAKLLAELNQETDHYQKLLTEAEERVMEAYALAWERWLRTGQLGPGGSVTGLRDQRLEAAEARTQEIVDEWERRTSKFPKKMQEESTRIIRDMGHDALWMDRDEGSGGRVVQTLVVLDPKKVFITGGCFKRASGEGPARSGSTSKRRNLPRHLQFLTNYLGARHEGLAAYFPETAKGALRPGPGERWFVADGIRYLGDNDGTMVPIQAEHLEPMPENLFDRAKLSALVEAVEAAKNPGVQPGYADLTIEDGELTAQVRDGNHRTFAPILAGGGMSWVMMSDSVRQDLDRRAPGSESLYRAIRAAQRAAGAPLFTRRPVTVGSSKPNVARLIALERRVGALRDAEANAYRTLLRRLGPAESHGRSLVEQEERPQLFYRIRLGELAKEHGQDWVEANIFDSAAHKPELALIEAGQAQRASFADELYDLRKGLGLKPGERLNPQTRKVEAW